MGLLDDFSSFAKSPEGVGLLSAAFGGMAAARKKQPWNTLGVAGLSGLTGYSNANEQAQQLEQGKQMQTLRDLQIGQTKSQLADADALRKFNFGQYYKTPEQQALANGAGPTVENAATIPTFAPKLDTVGMVDGMLKSDSPTLQQQALGMLQKEDAPMVLGEGGQLVTRSGKVLASNANGKPVNGYLIPDGQGGYKIDQTLYDAEAKLKRAGASNTTVSYGAPVAGVDNNGNPVFFQPSKDGGAPAMIPGVKPANTNKKTEDQAKNEQLYTRTVQQLPLVEKNFDALGSPGNIAGNMTRQAYLTSPQFQIGDAALKDIAASYLYSVSGATANPGEVANLVDTLRPRIGESQEAKDQKKIRLRQMVESIKTRTADTAGMPAMPAAISAVSAGGWSAKAVK